MPPAERTIPSDVEQLVVLDALAKAGALPLRSRKDAARITRFTGPGHDVADVTSILGDLVTAGDASNVAGLYRLTNQGLVRHRQHPRPRQHRAAA